LLVKRLVKQSFWQALFDFRWKFENQKCARNGISGFGPFFQTSSVKKTRKSRFKRFFRVKTEFCIGAV
jgi:hypothetical protein